MPTFEIGLDDGRNLQIDADNQAAALSGVQHFIQSDQSQNKLGTAGALATEAFKGVPFAGAYAPQVASFVSQHVPSSWANPVSPEDVSSSLQAYEGQHPYLAGAAQFGGAALATAPFAATGIGARALGLVGNNVRQQAIAGALS